MTDSPGAIAAEGVVAPAGRQEEEGVGGGPRGERGTDGVHLGKYPIVSLGQQLRNMIGNLV
jgi:hypothetical protein